VYNYTIEAESNDPLVDMADRTMEQFSEATIPGRWLVDMFPLLEYLPEWMPGGAFKKTARIWREDLVETVRVPYEFVKRRVDSGQDGESFVAKSIQQSMQEGSLSPLDEQAIKWTSTSMYLAGSDTSVYTMEAFFLAMSMFPDVQKKAQEEIDRVVGTSVLPGFTDRNNLPYINALVLEAQRWHPILPMGFPHVAEQEDEIEGYRIPKGAMLLPAVWWFTRDPAVYHNAEQFKPERYKTPYNEPSPNEFTFGFGRRICPGRYLADASLYLLFAQTLAAFKIEKALNDAGQEIEPTHCYLPGVISGLKPFKVRVIPRSSAQEKLVSSILDVYPWEKSDKDELRGLKTYED
jgi:cytochrome P450